MRTSSAIGFGSDGGSPRSLDLATMRLESSATLRVVSRRVRSHLNAHPKKGFTIFKTIENVEPTDTKQVCDLIGKPDQHTQYTPKF